MSRVTIAAVVASAVLLLDILEMARRRETREEYPIKWLVGSLALLILVSFSTPSSKLRRMNKGMAQAQAPLD